MADRRSLLLGLVGATSLAWTRRAQGAEPPLLGVHANNGKRVALSWQNDVSSESMGAYVYADEKIRRPYFENLGFPFSSTRLTRNHPPQDGDSEDHATMHPGVWLAFGDLNGHDFWRNQGRVVLEKFVERPTGGGQLKDWRVSFTALHRYDAADGTPVARETFVCRMTSFDGPGRSWTLDWDSTLEPIDKPLVFGDQEEMGLGVRLATDLTVAKGGRIKNSEGREQEKGVWGRPADWCLYTHKDRGVLLLAHPENFKKSSFHVRDYGLMVANPFAEQAFGRGGPAKTTVKPGEKLRLRYRLVMLGNARNEKFDPAALYQDYVAPPQK